LLPGGRGQSLATTFIPANTVDFNNASRTVLIDVLPAQPTFSKLAAPTIPYRAASTTLSGHLAAGTLPATGAVMVTLNGVTQAATINSSGDFSTTFDTSSLPVKTSPYTVTYAYAGMLNFAATSANSSLTVLSPQQQITSIKGQVNTLVSAKYLSAGNGQTLLSMLDGAITALNGGDSTTAINYLNKFIKQVNIFQAPKKLTPAQAQGLIIAAQTAIASA
jgi:hypothetical protein